MQLNKFAGVDFKYDNGSFEFQPENTQNVTDYVFYSKCIFLFLHETSHIQKFEGTDFEKWKIVFFKFYPKISKCEILLKTQKFFIFKWNFKWT